MSDEGLHYHDEATVLWQELIKRDPRDPVNRFDLARNFFLLGNWLRRAGRTALATENYQRARDLQAKLVEENPEVQKYERDLSSSLKALDKISRKGIDHQG